MRCPNHSEARIYSLGGMVTLMSHRPYWEDGVFHDHDPNKQSMAYDCAEGCRIFSVGYERCPAPDCDYGSEPFEITVEQP